MKQLPQVLLVDDNPADVVLAREALAGASIKAASAMWRMARRRWPFCTA